MKAPDMAETVSKIHDALTDQQLAMLGTIFQRQRAKAILASYTEEVVRGEQAKATVLRQKVRDELALCFGVGDWDRQAWTVVSEAFDDAWPEATK